MSGQEPLSEEPFKDLDAAVRALRERAWITEGVPTFLLLEDTAGSIPVPDVQKSRRPDATDLMLGHAAEELLERLAGAAARYDRPSLRDNVALTLEVLATRNFAPPAAGAVTPTQGVQSGQVASKDRSLAAHFAAGRYVRAVNFHATPRRFAERLEAQLSWLAERFVAVKEEDLANLMQSGEWPHRRPGVMINFFDGHRDNLEVAVPMLERLGLIGWFFLVAGWISTPPADHRSFAIRYGIDLPSDPRDAPQNGSPLALSPAEVADLAARGHAVASHTLTHAVPFDPWLTFDALEHEATGSKRQLESLLDERSVRALAWPFGTPLGAYERVDEIVRAAGYEFVLSNRAVQQVR